MGIKRDIKRMLQRNLEIPAGVDGPFQEALAGLGASPAAAPAPVTARRHSIRKTVLIAAALVMALGLATAGYAIVGQWFVDRSEAGGIWEMVLVSDESEAGFFRYAPVPDDAVLEQVFVDTYEKAAALFEQDFSAPKIKGYAAKSFEYYNEPGIRTAVYVKLANDFGETLYYFAEKVDSEPRGEWRVHGTIEELLIKGYTVYLARSPDGERGMYVWRNGSLMYWLNGFNDSLSDEEYIQIIKSML